MTTSQLPVERGGAAKGWQSDPSGIQNGRMPTPPIAPKQLRLIIETDDFDSALRFYRDVLGIPEQLAFATEGDDRVAILHAGIATIELATPSHATAIDEVEGAPHTPGVLRIALEVDDTQRAVATVAAEGTEVIAPPVRTPFQSLNGRVQGPAGWQVTFFQELETLEQRTARDGFTTDDARERQNTRACRDAGCLDQPTLRDTWRGVRTGLILD